jgi:hypothetical protein
MDRNRKILVSAQRAALVRTSTAYRTVSHGALCVVTGSMPIHIKARLRWKEYEAKKGFGGNRQGEAYEFVEVLRSMKQEAEDSWGIEWAFHNPSNWSRRLIKNHLIFVRRKRRINHYVMQILAGHGIFNYYRPRIGKESHTSCWDCGGDLDEAQHALLSAPDWWWRGLRTNPRWG